MSSGTIGSLIVQLGADTAVLQSDLGRANALFQKRMEQMTKQAEQMGKAVGIAAAGAATALAAMVKHQIDVADDISKLSQKVGMSTEALSSLRHMANMAGVDIAGLQTGLVKLNKAATEAAGGSKQQAAAFRAMGVSVRDAQGVLKPTEKLLGEVAEKFSGYEDSAAKTALAVQLFGKSGADLIPMLNAGAKGIKDAADEAKAYGLVVGGDAAKAAEAFNDNVSRLKMAAEGFANKVAQKLLPSLASFSGKLAEGAKRGDDFARAADSVVTGMKYIIKAALVTKGAIEGLTNMVAASIDTLIGFSEIASGVLTNIGHATAGAILAASGQYVQAKQQFDLAGVALGSGWEAGANRIKVAWSAASSGIDDAIKTADRLAASLDKPTKVTGMFANVIGGVGAKAKKAKAPITDLGSNAGKSAKAANDLANLLARDANELAKLRGELNPTAKIQQEYVRRIQDAQKAYGELFAAAKKNGASEQQLAAIKASLVEKTKLAQEWLAKETAALAAQGDVAKQYLERIANDSALAGLTDRERELERAVQDVTKAYEDAVAKGVPMKQSLEDVQETIRAAAGAAYDFKKAIDQSQEVARGWMSIWQNAGQSIARTFSDVLVNGGSLFKGLKDMAKQTVALIIEYFIQLRVIGPIMNGIFGGRGGLMQRAGMAMMPTGSSGTGQILGSGVAASGGGDFNLMSSQSWMTAGKSLFNGFDAASKASSNWMGTYTPDYGTGTYAPSTFGYAAAGVTGAYMGYNRWQNSNKDIGGGLGAAAYGVGGYSLAIGAGAAMSGGLAAGMAAIPVVGWIALAAMAVDYLSGGKLFGTKGKLDSTKMQLDVGAEGVNLAQSYVLKGQKAFFGGAKWSEHSIAPNADALAAAQQFYDAILKNRDIFARQFNAQVGDLVGGAYKAEYDKKGNLKNESVTVLGHEYKGETQEDLGKRLGAENMIAVLTQFDAQLSKMAESYRSSVDQITEFAQAATVAQGALKDGIHFLALGTDESASKIIGLADKTMILGESIDQAVQRIVQAQQAYDQFVQQFAPAVNYVDDFEASMSGLYAQMKANIKQANDLAKAAGAEGASAKDLANIHAYAAKQYAALRAQLEDSAKSLAYSMGLIGAYSLDQINAEIAALQEKANQSSQSVTRFGDSMSEASQKANDAINLLLGNLSPLNDQEKLQKAMEGLRAGTVSQEQVLEIGRRLYASSQAYNDLFREVQRYGGRAANDPGYSASAQQMTSAAGGFTQADKDRLADLLKQQQQLQAAQDLYNAQTLARQIAELSAADGVDFHEILDKWGLSADDLTARLHLDNEAQLQAWIENAQKQTDDNGENTTILAGWLEKIFNALVEVQGGPGLQTHGFGNTGRNVADDVATGVERGLERGLGPYRGRGIRNQVNA